MPRRNHKRGRPQLPKGRDGVRQLKRRSPVAAALRLKQFRQRVIDIRRRKRLDELQAREVSMTLAEQSTGG